MCGARDFKGLIGTRFLLGVAESAIAPTFIAITNMWYRRSEQTLRNSFWYASLGAVNILGSLLAYGLGHIKSPHLYTYQIIFLFCGLLTFVVSIFVLFFLPDSPMSNVSTKHPRTSVVLPLPTFNIHRDPPHFQKSFDVEVANMIAALPEARGQGTGCRASQDEPDGSEFTQLGLGPGSRSHA
jgi:MFS family permease